MPPSPTPQWAGAGWGGRSQRIQVSPSPQQLMPHTLKSQPERTQMLGKERSEDASRAGWRRWHPAGGDSTDQPRHSWLQPAPRPGLPCSCSVPGGVRGRPWVTPVSPQEHLPLSFRAPPGAEAVVPVSLQAVQRLRVYEMPISTPAPDQPLLHMFPQWQRVFIGPIVH